MSLVLTSECHKGWKDVLVDDGLDYTRLKELVVTAGRKYLSWILAVKENRNEKLSTVQ